MAVVRGDGDGMVVWEQELELMFMFHWKMREGARKRENEGNRFLSFSLSFRVWEL